MKKTSSKHDHLLISDSESEVLTMGLDLGDRTSHYCGLNSKGEVAVEGSLHSSPAALHKYFVGLQPCRVALEVGGHSRWVSSLLTDLGFEVIVANTSQVRLIYESSRKTDKVDARTLARLARVDPCLLSPIQHRNKSAQSDLCVIRARQALVAARTQLINCVRGMVKSFGERLPTCSSDSFFERVAGLLPELLRPALEPLCSQIALLTQQIQSYEQQIKDTADHDYPETNQPIGITRMQSNVPLRGFMTKGVEDLRSKEKNFGLSGMRGRPKKPTVREAILPAFEFLKRDSHAHDSRAIFDHVTKCLAKQGFEEKTTVTNFALTCMSREGLIRKVRHTYWQVTGVGMSTEMTLELADTIEQGHDPALRRAVLQNA